MRLFASKLTVYLSVRPHWLSVRAFPRRGSPVQIEGMARVAIRVNEKEGRKVVAIGDDAVDISASDDIAVYDAFCHPRVLIGDFDAAEIVVREFLRQTCGNRKHWQKFDLIIQVPDDLEGGFTDIEERAFQELGLRLGAGRIAIQTGKTEISDTKVAALR